MKSKELIVLMPAQKRMVVAAMRTYRLTLKGENRPLFDIAFRKVNAMKLKLELDGMEMIFVTQALKKRAKLLIAIGKISEADHYRNLGNWFENTRINFQIANGPQIKKQQVLEHLTASRIG